MLNHPHIMSTYSLEEVEDMGLCIVSEWIEGVTLGEWLKNKQNINERRRVFMQILDPLEYIHSLQLVHNDIKLDNIMVTTNGTNVKLRIYDVINATNTYVDATSALSKINTLAIRDSLVNLYTEDPASAIYVGTVWDQYFTSQYNTLLQELRTNRTKWPYPWE